jgi:hypothetical protein
MPSPIVWNSRISPPILRNSYIEVGQMGQGVIKAAHTNGESRGRIRESSKGAKSWIDEVLRDGVPKTDKLMPLHPRDPHRFPS